MCVVSLHVGPVPPAALLAECMWCNEGSGVEDRVELLKGLSQVVPGSGDSTAGSVGVCAGTGLCVCASVCVCLLLNQHYLVFVQIVAGYLPPANTSVCVFLAKPPGPFVRGRSQLVSLAGLSQQQAHPHHWPDSGLPVPSHLGDHSTTEPSSVRLLVSTD